MANASHARLRRILTSVSQSVRLGQSAIVMLVAVNSMMAQDAPTVEQHAPRQNAVTLLVLQSGHVIDGRVSESPGGYVVDKPNGRMVIPFRLVRFQAANHAEALKKFKQLYPDQNTQTRMSIAEWCVAQHMYQEAIGELHDALESDPDDVDARLMLDRLETLASRNEPVANDNVPAKTERTSDGFRVAQPESSTGLSPESVREFTTRIQPILLNKCGNAACHGRPGDQGFALTHVRGGQGGRRTGMEKNLAQTMKYIDKAHPAASALLTIPQGDHGMRKRPVFVGPHEEELLKTMKAWIARVGYETGDEGSTQAASPAFPSRAASKQPSGTLFVSEKATEQPPAEVVQDVPAAELTRSDPVQADDAAAKPTAAPQDRFDPDAFNRAVLGGSRPTR